MGYDESSIKVLKGLEPVRKRPGMYIGSTDTTGLHHLVWEIFDNSIDEVLAGFANQIKLILHKDGSVSVADNGRGIPCGINVQSGLNSIDTVYTILHAGGKFDSNAYKTAGGLHGVGASVVNALSKWMTVNVFRDHKHYESKYINGGKIKQAATLVGPTTQHGTTVRFLPDPSIFSVVNFNGELINEYLREKSFLFHGLKIEYVDEINQKNSEIFCSKAGLVDFVNFINYSRKTLSKIIQFNGDDKEIHISVALQFVEGTPGIITSFANSIKTNEGGSHENGFKQAVYEAINNYARERNFLKEKDKKFESVDIRDTISGVISVHVPEKLIIFEGQTKNKLLTVEVESVIKRITQNQLKFWFNENLADAEKIIQNVIANRDARLAVKRARDDLKKMKGITQERRYFGKLTPCQSSDPRINEIFLVEGDSAGGSAKLGRDRVRQAILPLRGKVINAEKSNLRDLLKNDEINSIIACLGGGVGANFDIAKLRFGKIIIMTDADTDGAHIQILLLTFFYRYMRQLLEEKKVFVALPPLYRIEKNDHQTFSYAWNDDQLNRLRDEYRNFSIQRYKGLGEMNPQQLWETTMDPRQRQLLNVSIEDAILAERQVSILMGDSANTRKIWINENVDFELDDQ